MSVVITIVQEARTEHVLEALRDLTSPRALVVRDGSRRRIAGREVVRGDLVVLGEGDRVPADAMLIDARDLQADESLLTGESVPVRKQPSDKPSASDLRPGGEDQPFVYSGSLVVRGEGTALVTATGPRSEIGKIGQSLKALSAEPPRLQQQTAKLVAFCGLGGAAVSVVAVLLYGTLRGDWLQALLGGIAIGMSMLPEEFPVVLTVFMAMGAWRISKARVLTRHAAAIETLGSATVLCTDKTGTLTQNRMSVAELRLPDGARASCPSAKPGDLDPQFVELARCSVLASSPEPVRSDGKSLSCLRPRGSAGSRSAGPSLDTRPRLWPPARTACHGAGLATARRTGLFGRRQGGARGDYPCVSAGQCRSGAAQRSRRCHGGERATRAWACHRNS
jgi:Ca2+-transporting ATPase